MLNLSDPWVGGLVALSHRLSLTARLHRCARRRGCPIPSRLIDECRSWGLRGEA